MTCNACWVLDLRNRFKKHGERAYFLGVFIGVNFLLVRRSTFLFLRGAPLVLFAMHFIADIDANATCSYTKENAGLLPQQTLEALLARLHIWHFFFGLGIVLGL